MKQVHRNIVLALMTAALVAFTTGCSTLQPTGVEMVSLVDHGGGGGDN